MIRKGIKIFILFFVFICFSQLSLKAEDVTVRVIGESSINKHGALQRAFQRAVEEGIGAYITSQQKVSNFELIYEHILKFSGGYVKDYEELSSGEEDGTYWVRIKATVTQDKILNELTALKILFIAKGKPRVMILADTGELEGDYSFLIQSSITNKFLEKDFLCVDPERVRVARYEEQVRQALAGNLQAAKSLGLKEEADVVAVAKAYREDIGEIYGLNPCRVSISGNAVWTDTGRLIAFETGTGANPFGSAPDAIKKAASNLSEKLIGKIVEKWNEEIINTGLIQIVATGLGYNELISFEDTLREQIPQIHHIYERSYEDYGKIGCLEVDSEFPASTLARILLRIEGFQITIKSRQANKINCEVKLK